LAAKPPSKRRHRLATDVELRLIPVMSLLCCLIPILLQAAVFVKIAAHEVNLPGNDDVRYLAEPRRQLLAQSLTLALTDQGFILASRDRTLARLPRIAGGAYDLEGLQAALRSAKQRFPTQDSIILLIEDGVIYDDIVHAMDRCRALFPAVSLADRVEVAGG
jgi:hypothetical protein